MFINRVYNRIMSSTIRQSAPTAPAAHNCQPSLPTSLDIASSLVRAASVAVSDDDLTTARAALVEAQAVLTVSMRRLAQTLEHIDAHQALYGVRRG